MVGKKNKTSSNQQSKPHEKKLDELIGRKISDRRKALGISQENLANQIGISFQQLQKYEKAENRVSASRLWSISQILQCPVSHFYGTEGSQVKASMPINPAYIKLAQQLMQMDDKKLRQSIIHLIETHSN